MQSFTVSISRKLNTEAILSDKEFKMADIVEFHAYNEPLKTKRSAFRRFMLQGILLLSNGEHYEIGAVDTAGLKKILRPLAKKVEKLPIVEYKNGKERKATNWTYKFKQ